LGLKAKTPAPQAAPTAETTSQQQTQRPVDTDPAKNREQTKDRQPKQHWSDAKNKTTTQTKPPSQHPDTAI